MRKGELLVNMIKWLDERVAQPPSCWVHIDNVYGGDIASMSGARLKGGITPVNGAQALDVLSQIRGCTYEREDLQQRRLGLIADEVESAVHQLAIGNVVSSKWHNDGQYKTLDYSRLVSLLIPAVTTLAKRVEDLESKINGNSS